MAAPQCIEQIGAWTGYELQDWREEQRGGQRWCVLTLRPREETVRRCSGCGWQGTAIHDQEQRYVRDLPLFDATVLLVVPRLRLACPHCGPKLEQLDWLEPYARVTTRLAASVVRLCKVMSLRHVAGFYGLAWSTVKLIDHRHLERELEPSRALRHWQRGPQLKTEDRSGLWAKKVTACKTDEASDPTAFEPDRTHQQLIEFLFPELGSLA